MTKRAKYEGTRPLNYKENKYVDESAKVYTTSQDSLINEFYRYGTPITRKGISKLQPNKLIPALDHDLYIDLSKATSTTGQETPSEDDEASNTEYSDTKGPDAVEVGARGGKIVGYTSEGRKIYAPSQKQVNKAQQLEGAVDRAFAKALGVPQVPLRPEQQQQQQMGPGQIPPPQGQMPQQGQPPQQGQQSPQQQGGQQQQGQQMQAKPQGQGSFQAPQGQPKIPGFNQMASAPQSMQASGNDKQMGQTKNGQPIMQDPFHPTHQQFGKDEHDQAAQQHQSQGNGANANAHSQMGKDAQSPMERGAERFGQQGGGQPQQGGHGAPPQGMGGQPPMHGQPPQQGGMDPSHQMLQLLENLKQLILNQGQQQPAPPLAAPKPPPMPMGMPGQQPGGMPPQGMAQGGPQMMGQAGMQEKKETGLPNTGPSTQPASPETHNSQGSMSEQGPKSLPRPQKQAGQSAPLTNAGNHQTPIEPTARKALVFDAFGWGKK